MILPRFILISIPAVRIRSVMNRSVIFTIFLSLLVSIGRAQDRKILYEMVKLGRHVNSRYHDAAPIVSPDGKTLYFFVANHPENNYGTDNSQDIWFTEKDEHGQWKEARRMSSPLNTHRFNQVLSVLGNGNTLFLRGGRGNDDSGFSFTQKVNGIWTTPDPIDVKGYNRMKKGVFSGGFMSIDGSVLLLYFSETEQGKYSDIYVSFKEGSNQYSRPVKIPEPISTRRDEFGPFLSTDMKTMYFASNRWGSLGSSDIYKTERLDDAWLKWSEPENIGPPVNTDGFDAYFSIDASGKNAFTTRAFMSADGGHLDILGLVPKPEIILSGLVLNEETGDPVPSEFEYLAVKKDTGWIKTDQDGHYKVMLDNRAIYNFVIVKDGFEILYDSIDLTGVDDYAEVNKDFMLVPEKAEIVLFGSVLEEGTLNPLQSSLSFYRDGQKIITTQSEANQGYYRTNLPGNGEYTVKINLDYYQPFDQTFEINTTEAFAEFEKDFYLIPMIELSGYVMNQKTNEPIEEEISWESNTGKEGTFRPGPNGYYQLFLPEKAKYYFRGTREGFINLSDSLPVIDYVPAEPLTKDLYFIPIEVGVTVRLNHIFFDFDKATLRPESFPELDRVVEFMKQNPTIQIEIGGHTDSMGSDGYNQELSQGRAESVRTYLVDQGIDATRIVAMGYGESQPEATNETEEGRQTNRRVEFKVLEK